MKKTKYLIACAVLLLFGRGWAQDVETLVLNDGSVLEGYMSVQRVGKDVTFTANRQVVVLQANCVASIAERTVEYKKLSDEWKKWVDNNPRSLSKDNKLVLSEIKLKVGTSDTIQSEGSMNTVMLNHLSSSPYNVRVLEKGEQIKYLDVTPHVYTLSWKDIKCLQRSPRIPLSISGVSEFVILKNGQKYEGEIVEQVPGRTMKLLKADGIVEVVDATNISSIKKKKLNDEQTIIEQVPLLETVRTEKEDYTGVIIEQNFNKGKDGNDLIMELQNGNSVSLNQADVIEICRIKNEHYKPLQDVVLDDTTMLINRNKVSYTHFEQEEDLIYTKNFESALKLNIDTLAGYVFWEMKDKVSLLDGCIMVQALELKGNKRKDKDKIMSIGFSYEDLVLKSIEPFKKIVSPNNTLKVSFQVNSAGWYIIYNPKKKEGIIFQISK